MSSPPATTDGPPPDPLLGKEGEPALDIAGLAAALLGRHSAAVPVDPAMLAAAEGLRVETRPLPRGAGERLEAGTLVLHRRARGERRGILGVVGE